MEDAQNEKILVTGASGFIGARLCDQLESLGENVVAVSRTIGQRKACVPIDLAADNVPEKYLKQTKAIIHCAARAHVIHDHSTNPLAEYRRLNVETTLKLANQAAQAGIRRFIFLSSIGVNGNINTQPFTEDDLPDPAEDYAQSKWEAEQGLWKIQQETGLEIVIIRPPLVYGPNAPGNFGSLVRFVEKGWPLPLGAIHNKRSLVALDSLVDLIITCTGHPAAANQLFLAGDGNDLSTTELLSVVAKAMGKRSRLVPVPAGLLVFGATILGKKAMSQRLLGSLQVEISKAREVLGWEPPVSVEEGVRRAVGERGDPSTGSR